MKRIAFLIFALILMGCVETDYELVPIGEAVARLPGDYRLSDDKLALVLKIVEIDLRHMAQGMEYCFILHHEETSKPDLKPYYQIFRAKVRAEKNDQITAQFVRDGLGCYRGYPPKNPSGRVNTMTFRLTDTDLRPYMPMQILGATIDQTPHGGTQLLNREYGEIAAKLGLQVRYSSEWFYGAFHISGGEPTSATQFLKLADEEKDQFIFRRQ